MESLIDRLNEEEFDEFLFNSYPLETESCSLCSHLRWGSYDDKSNLTTKDENGEIPCCSDKKGIWEMSYDPSAERISAEDALNYKICERYDGPLPYEKEEVVEWLETRKQIVKELGFEPGKYYKDNRENAKLVDCSKLEIGNKCHIGILKGYEKIPIELISPLKLSKELKKTTSSYINSLYAFSKDLWEYYLKENKDKKNLNVLSEGIASYLTKLNGWTIEDFYLGSDVLNYLIKPKEWKLTNRNKGWYSDIHKYVIEPERKELIKDFTRCLAGVSYSISES